MNVGFVGAGQAGATLSRAFVAVGEKVVAVASRGGRSARELAASLPDCAATSAQGVADRADLVLIATPDDVIASVAASVHWRDGQRVVHISGATPVSDLSPAALGGALIGGFHPLQTFANPNEALASLPGIRYGIEADEPLFGELAGLAEKLGGTPIRLTAESRAIYHASAVIASNYLVTLASLATSLWREIGVEPAEALRALLPLARGTIRNLERVGLPDSLTGPIARGDVGTLSRHLAALDDRSAAVAAIYRALGDETVGVALAKGTISPAVASVIRDTLREPLKSTSLEERPSCCERS